MSSATANTFDSSELEEVHESHLLMSQPNLVRHCTRNGKLNPCLCHANCTAGYQYCHSTTEHCDL